MTTIPNATPLGSRAEKIMQSYCDLRQSLQGLLVDILKDCSTIDATGKMSENGSLFGYLVAHDNMPRSYKAAIKDWVQTYSCFTFKANIPQKDKAKVGQRTKDGLPLYDHKKGSENPFWTMASEKPPQPYGMVELLKDLAKFRDKIQDIATDSSDSRILVRKKENKPKLEKVAGTIEALIAKLEGNEGEPQGNVTKDQQSKDKAKDIASKPLKGGGKAIHVASDVVANNPLEVTMQ